MYVEVRPAQEQDAVKGSFGEAAGEGMSQVAPVPEGPAELLSQLAAQTTCQTLPAVRRLTQEHTYNQSPSRHTVSFQLQHKITSQSPTVPKRPRLPGDGISAAQCSPSGRVAAPGTPPTSQRFSEEKKAGEGTRSVVTFSYVEKPNVRTVESPRGSRCERGAREDVINSSPFCKRLNDSSWWGSPDSSRGSSPKLAFRQTALDPIGRAATQRAVEEFGSPLLRIKLAHALEQESTSRYYSQQRCQSWAGSPVQRQNNCRSPIGCVKDSRQGTFTLQSTVTEQLSEARHPSLGASHRPRPRSCVGPESPVHWPVQHAAPSGSPATQGHHHKACMRVSSPQGAILQLGNKLVEGMNQLSDSKSPSPAHSPEVARRLAEDATKVSSFFTEATRGSLHNALGEPTRVQGPSSNAQQFQQHQQTLQMNIPLHGQHAPATDNIDGHQPESSLSQSHSQETNSRNNHDTPQEEEETREEEEEEEEEETKQGEEETRQDERERGGCQASSQQHHNSIMSETADPGSPALPARFLRPSHPPTDSSSPMRDPRLLRAEVRALDSPTLHRRQPPQYTGDVWSAGMEQRGDPPGAVESVDCTELSRRLFIRQGVEEAPVSWTSRQHWGKQQQQREEAVVVVGQKERGLGQFPNRDVAPAAPASGRRPQRGRRALSPAAQQKRAEQRRREALLLGPVALDSAEEDEDDDEDDDEEEEEEEEEDEDGEGGERPLGSQRIQEPLEGEQNGALGGSSSRSSSGVTGSLGERDCVSPESSQSSHQSNDTAAVTSGIQVSFQ